MTTLVKSVLAKQNLSFSFEECFDNNEVRRQMREFCNELNNEELILFVQALAEYSKLRGQTNKAMKLQEMYQMFIVESSSLCLNLKGDTRADIHERFKEHAKQFQEHTDNESSGRSYELLVDPEVFCKAEEEVLSQLKTSIFPLFVKSPEFEAYIKKNADSIDQLCTSNSSSCTAEEDISSYDILSGDRESSGIKPLDGSITEQQFLRNVMDLKPQVSERDITSLLSISYSENIWHVLASEPVYTVYTTASEKTDFKSVMVTGTVPYSVDILMKAICSKDFRMSQDKCLTGIQELQYSRALSPYAKDGSKEFSTVLTKETYKFQWPISSREFVLASTVVYMKPTDQYQERYVIMYKSTTHIAAPKTKNPIRALSAGGYICERISDHESRYHLIMFVDYKGWMSKKVVASTFKNKGFESHSALMSALSKVSKQGQPISYKLLDTLNDFTFNHAKHNNNQKKP